MRKAILPAVLLAFVWPAALWAQSIVTIPPRQCVWRAGDDPAWAAPNLDETGWQPYAHWKEQDDEPRIWVRCHTDLSSLRALANPAIQISRNAGYAYQLFVNGEQIGEEGNLSTGMASRNEIRQYPLPAGTLQTGPAAVALRITLRFFAASDSPLQVHAGEPAALSVRRAEVILANSAAPLANAVCFALIGVVGLMLLGLFHYDRSRRELLYLSIECLSLALLRINEFCAAAQIDYSSAIQFASVAVGNIVGPPTYLLFFFALAGRRVPRLFWLPATIIVLNYALLLVSVTSLLSPGQSLWLNGMVSELNLRTLLGLIAQLAIAAAPFIAFWPYGKVAGRMRPLAVLCMLWAAVSLFWFAIEMTINPLLGLPNLFVAWRPELLGMRAIVTAGVLVALLALLFRDQRRVTQERALLAGEMQAASEIQQMLAPSEIETAPGLRIDVAFCPMSNVGGDFYLCRALPDGRQRVLIGDVSGKGAAAAMAATLLLGAAEERDGDSPGKLLLHLNRVLRHMRLGGFATCLCADVAPDGTVKLANAGHLPPYRDGREIQLDPSLPLGVAPETQYSEITLAFSQGGTLVFLSDGVVEARNASGELFGFERTRALSTESAQNIARAASTFGQEDDITVLTLTMVPVEVAHA